jgi:hypothetical protein
MALSGAEKQRRHRAKVKQQLAELKRRAEVANRQPISGVDERAPLHVERGRPQAVVPEIATPAISDAAISDDQLPAHVTARARDGKWLPGRSANPGGRIASSDEYRRCRLLCRSFSQENILEIKRLRDSSDDDRVRLLAAQWLDEKAWGKNPPPYDPANDPEMTQDRINVAAFTPEERAVLRALLAKGRSAPGYMTP